MQGTSIAILYKVILMIVLGFSYLSLQSFAQLQPENVDLQLQPKELMVLSILDFANDTVVRDLLTMIRSIRLFGGTLNDATIVIGVISKVSTNEVHQELDFAILADLASLGVELEFLDATTGDSQQSRTLNKLQAFQLFDPLRFSHVLWLDADILILNDPIPHLIRHSHPGSIDCVPELYSYMRRYPGFNASDTVWNAHLPAVEVLGDDNIAPAGTCNTGVLLLDSVVLPTIIRAIERFDKDNIVPLIFKNDRFLDSLYLVLAVNQEAVEINYLPYQFNYMAFFIGEYHNLQLGIESIYFAHFLWEPFFYCSMSPAVTDVRTTCECVSSNQYQSDDDILYRTIQHEIVRNDSVCRFLAGDYKHSYPSLLKPNGSISSQSTVANSRYDDDRYHVHLHRVLQSDPHAYDIFLNMPSDCDDQNPTSNIRAESTVTMFQLSFHCEPLWPPIFWQETLQHSSQVVSVKFLLKCESVHLENEEKLSVSDYVLFGLENITQIHAKMRLTSSATNALIDFDRSVLFSEDEAYDNSDNYEGILVGSRRKTRYFRSETLDISVQPSSDNTESIVFDDNDKYNSHKTSSFYKRVETLTIAVRYAFTMKLEDAQHRSLNTNDHFICLNSSKVVNTANLEQDKFLVWTNISLLPTYHPPTTPMKAVYAINVLHSSRSFSLSSQLLLPEYLQSMSLLMPSNKNNNHYDNTNKRHLRSILFCCDSAKGVQTVQRLLASSVLSSSSSSTLLVILSLPALYLSKSFVSSILPASMFTNDESNANNRSAAIMGTIIQALFGKYCAIVTSRSDGNINDCRIISTFATSSVHSVTDLSTYLSDESHADSQKIRINAITNIVQSFRKHSFRLIYWDILPISPDLSHQKAFEALFQVLLELLASSNRKQHRSLLIGSTYFAEADEVKLYQTETASIQPINSHKSTFEHLRNINTDKRYIQLNTGQLSIPMLSSFLFIRQIVKQIQQIRETPPFFTYAEALPAYCGISSIMNFYYDDYSSLKNDGTKASAQVETSSLETWWRECAPAWYLWV